MAYHSHTTFVPDKTIVASSDSVRVSTMTERRVISERRDRFMSFAPSKESSFSLLKLVFIILLISCVFAALSGGATSKTFTGFLEWLKDFHPLIDNVRFVNNSIDGSWGIFDGLRVLINMLVIVFNFLVFIAESLINLVSYIGGFFSFLFA